MKTKVVDSIIDLNELANRLSNDQLFMFELLNEYIKDLEEKLNQIEMLLIEGNLPAIKRIVHSLKGSTSFLNVHYIWQAVCLLESALNRNDLKMVDIYFEILKEEQSQLVKYLDTIDI
jgi:HPt (histidine-containing phosphotransfer) domain-containing protein